MNVDFWKEEYFLNPDFEEMYAYIDKCSDQAYLFYPFYENEFGEELFYQLCVSGEVSCKLYFQYEKNLYNVWEELLGKETFVAYAEGRSILQNPKATKLTGLSKPQLNRLKSFCDKRQFIETSNDMELLLQSATRGIGATCILATNWKLILLMQDLHGCILTNEHTDAQGVMQMLEVLEKNDFAVCKIDGTVS